MLVPYKSEPEEVNYYKQPALAFRTGYVARIGKRRHGHAYYWRYHFFLPRTTAPVLRLLKRYFYHLDTEQKIPPEHRRRQTKWECFETAIDVLHEVRKASMGGISSTPLQMGSDYLCPLPWAVIGYKAREARSSQHYFTSVTDVFERYDSLMWAGGYNTVAVDRPLGHEKGIDKLRVLLNTYQQTANYVLATALFLLHDLVLNGGPDCSDFIQAFSNDRRGAIDEDAWTIARQAVIGCERKNIDVFTGQLGTLRSRKSGRTNRSYKIPQRYSTNSWSAEVRRAYWEVTLVEKNYKKGDPLTSGEKIARHKERQKPSPPIIMGPEPQPTSNDAEIDSTLEPVNPIFEAMKNNIPSMSQDTEVYGDWSGL